MLLHPIYKFIPYAIVLLACVAGLFIDILEIDAAQYAVMSRDMLAAGDLLHLKDRGLDYLDKPPLIFWCTALSYKLFGVSTFSYKLPSFLFAILAVRSTVGLSGRFYSQRIAFLSGVIFASAQAFFLMNNDVKTDMYLIGPMVFAVWQVVAYMQEGKWYQLVLGFTGIGLSFLAKGPLGLVAPAMVLGADLLLKRDWRNIFRWQWLLGLALVALILTPFCIGLHEQFGAKGIRFFLWTQSFGRVTGESEWSNDASPFFLVHTYAWAFLPWTILSLVAYGRKFREVFRDAFFIPKSKEAISLAGFTLLFIAFSLSKFKLPHYIFVVLPFAAIFTAQYLDELIHEVALRKWSRVFKWLHFSFFVLVAGAVNTLMAWSFPGAPWWIWALSSIGFLGIFAGFFLSKDAAWKHLLPTAIGFAFANLVLNFYLYPELLKYQSSGQAGRYVAEQQIPQERVFAYRLGGRSFDFYSGKVLAPGPDLRFPAFDSLRQTGTVWYFTNWKGKEEFDKEVPEAVVEQEYDHFRVSNLSLPFINPALRGKVIGKRYLMRVDHE